MEKKKSGGRTLLMSVIMSAPGPLIVGLGLLVGKSTTQMADFVRRSAELLAIIASFIVYQLTTKDNVQDMEKKARLERVSNLFVGISMCLGGTIMFVLAFFSADTEKGNVIPGLAVAVMGVIANCIFWRRYTKLNREEPNAILAVQATLYRAKTFVDFCVTLALASVLILPDSKVSVYLDFIGTLIVSLYLVWSGIKTVRETVLQKQA